MVFSSLEFLCGFLPLTIIGYRFLAPKYRNRFLLIMSLLFYAWGEPIYVLLMAASIAVNYFGGIYVDKMQREGRNNGKPALIATIVINLVLLGFFKYTDFLLGTVNSLTGASIPLLKLALPIGISFYTFQALSYVIDVYRGDVAVQRNWVDFAMYVTLFPQLIAGPIVRYSDVENQIHRRKAGAGKFWDGIFRFCIGLGKKALLANQAGKLWDTIAAQDDRPMAMAWLGAIAFTFQIYFDFSGYSDMAIGLGKMFGFDFPENFRYPYEADSITEFWRRWHITLSTWFREYVYIPLGGNRCGKRRQMRNLLIVWALTGLWHGAGWNFLCWGLYFFLLLVLEKNFLLKKLKQLPSYVGHLYALLMIVLGWVLFAVEDFKALGEYLASMVGVNGFTGELTHYLYGNYILLLGIMAIGCTHYPAKLVKRITAGASAQRKTTGSMGGVLLQGIWAGILLWLSMSAIIADSYNPFLYFRF